VAADRDWLGSSQDSGCEICDSWHFDSDIKKYYDGEPFGLREDQDPAFFSPYKVSSFTLKRAVKVTSRS
jgi:hypothetical protein